jgi:transcriptional regulator with XRE-family HTH domain
LTFGQTIRLARQNLRLSQATAVFQIKKSYPGLRLSGSYLCMIENDQKTNLSIKLIRALINFFKIAPAYVIPLLSVKNETACVAENPANYLISPAFLEIYQSLTEAEKSQTETFMNYLKSQRTPAATTK